MLDQLPVVLKQLELFPSIILSALDSLEPQLIASYLQETATKFHKYYANCRIINDEEDLTLSRIALARAIYKKSQIIFLDEFTSNLDVHLSLIHI